MAFRRAPDLSLVSRALAVAVAVACVACDADADPMVMTADGPIPQDDSRALLDWLRGRGYAQWPGESEVHPGTGPHFGDVRTFLSDELVDSLEAGATQHPAGSATVKELYETGDSVLGWSVSIKRDADSADGDNWYWFEYFDGGTLADAQGLSVCTGCHRGGIDFVLIPFPLR